MFSGTNQRETADGAQRARMADCGAARKRSHSTGIASMLGEKPEGSTMSMFGWIGAAVALAIIAAILLGVV
ncbi:MAG: hypothetical protein MEQ84_08455 [Mesorhizobium sp.]|nr:hypothetical protein [Mesorhizobium sp.]